MAAAHLGAILLDKTEQEVLLDSKDTACIQSRQLSTSFYLSVINVFPYDNDWMKYAKLTDTETAED